MRPVHVLVVDDEAELVSALVERLELRGFAAQGVTSGAGALACLATEPFDVVVADVKMPGLGGLELVRAIRRRWPEKRIVLLTGHTSAEAAAAGEALEVDAYLLKPVDIAELARVLEGAVKEVDR